MALHFAGFPVATFKTAGDPLMLTLATVRAECDIRGRCFKTQRFLATRAGMALGSFNRQIARAQALGILVLIRRGRRKSAVMIFRPEHRWATSEKPAPDASECSTRWDTKSKATFKKGNIPPEPPVSPSSTGGARLDEQSIEEGNHGSDGGAVAAPTATRPGGSRRTAYGALRQPRAPRKLRQRWRQRNAARAYLDAAAAIEARRAGSRAPIALAPEPEIISPAEWQRQQQRRSRSDRGFLDIAEAIERERRGGPPIFHPQFVPALSCRNVA
jgi:hypothetical protein